MFQGSLVLILTLSILYGEIACQEARLRIVNGLRAQPGNFPYQVSLQIYDINTQRYSLHCGGSILDQYHVLTAAHCVEGLNYKIVSIVAGSSDLTGYFAGTRHQLVDIKIHENYQAKNSWANDIALLRLATPFVFSEYIQPATLPQRGEYLLAGQPAVVSGFGQTDSNSPTSPVLFKTQVFIESNSVCQRYHAFDHIRPTNICTSHNNRLTGFCKGDSGGPLTVNGKVVGIVSFAPDNGCAGKSLLPQVYTRVSSYIDWINYWRNS